MNANQFATKLKQMRNAFANGTEEGSLLCEELSTRPDIADAALELATMLCLVAGLGELLNKSKNPS